MAGAVDARQQRESNLQFMEILHGKLAPGQIVSSSGLARLFEVQVSVVSGHSLDLKEASPVP